MAVDFDWRFGLKTGDLVDVVDNLGKWHLSTIVGLSKNPQKTNNKIWLKYPIMKVVVGFRVFNENGDKEMDDGKKYFGFSEAYDEEINVISARIRR